jgi:hypothetical protein
MSPQTSLNRYHLPSFFLITVSWFSLIFNFVLACVVEVFYLVFCSLVFELWFGWFSWINGARDAQIGSNVIPLDPASVASEVWHGKESANYTSRRRRTRRKGQQRIQLFTVHCTHSKVLWITPLASFTMWELMASFTSEEHAFETLPFAWSICISS